MDLLTINKRDANADEDQGPSVDSEDINERIEARRQRIKKKNEMNKKKKSGAFLPAETEKKKEVSKGRKQIQDSRGRLMKLEKDGVELVTNIRVAGDTREHVRRNEEEEASRVRKERLEQESKIATDKFEEIIKKWETAQSKEIPQELHEMLMDQKQLCDSMIEEKNKLINDFKQELKQKDDSYVKTLKKYAEEIDLLIERMKDQMFNMRKFYAEELVNIENAFVNERKELLDKHRKEWDEKMEERKSKELAFLDAYFKRVEKNETELNNLRVKDAEEYNEVKIKLETDVQILEQQLQQMKATYQLNQEKLEYNYQVLQKRDEENAKTKAQQKRKITKLQDALTNLKKKLAKQIKQFNDENQQLSEEYKRVTDMFNDLQMKSKHFIAVDLKKFHDIWKMNEVECKKFAFNLLEADRILHEHQLGIDWKSPDVSFMENVGPINGSEQQKTGKEFLDDLLSPENEEEVLLEDDEFLLEQLHHHQQQQQQTGNQNDTMPTKSDSSIEKQKRAAAQFRRDSHTVILNLSKSTLRNIIMLICDEAGFLLEQKLVHLLNPLEKNEQSMVKLDSIFKALGVETEKDVRLLAQYFINHRQYKELIKNKHYIQKNESRDHDNNKKSNEENDEKENNQARDLFQDGSDLSSTKTVPSDSIQLINQNEVISALKTFVALHHKSDNQIKLSKFRLTNLDNRDDSADSEYWLKYENLIDDKKDKLWDAMLYGLQNYHTILNRRAELIDENKALANQNIELRMLLAQYMQSNVNQELQIPPTKIIQ